MRLASAVHLALPKTDLAETMQRRHKDHLFELHMAVEASEKENQLRCARALLDERLTVEASMIDQFWLNDVPPQLHWLREPASLRLLLQRPAWLDEASRRGGTRLAPLAQSAQRLDPQDPSEQAAGAARAQARAAPIPVRVCVCLAASETHTAV